MIFEKRGNPNSYFTRESLGLLPAQRTLLSLRVILRQNKETRIRFFHGSFSFFGSDQLKMTRPDLTRPDTEQPEPSRPDPTRPDPTQPDPTREI